MAGYSNFIGKYERIPYNSFVWKFGTTSFRTNEFNRMIEWQLKLLDKFWENPENKNQGWEKKYMVPGQKDIYEIKNRYYDWLVKNGFTKGNERIKYKTAREKTSGLYDMGLINENRRITDVGRHLLELSDRSGESLLKKNNLNITNDSQVYLEQLLKLSVNNAGSIVRPFIVVLYLLAELNYLTYDEFRYLTPLCISKSKTEHILKGIKECRMKNLSIDKIIEDVLMELPNYKKGLSRFVKEKFSEDLLLSVSMNRKSPNYDKSYIVVYEEMHAVYMCHDYSRIVSLFGALNQLSTKNMWKPIMFNTDLTSSVKRNPQGSLLPLPEYATESEESFKKFFFVLMHVNKAKSMLEDYFDLNRRYLGLSNCFLFDDELIKLDIIPKHYFGTAIKDLYEQAYNECSLLFESCPIEKICKALKFNEENIIEGIKVDLDINIDRIEEVYDVVDKVRYERFNKLIDNKFKDQNLLVLLDYFKERNDIEIKKMVTDNADIPTIFEYVLGIIWYKVSGREGKILDYLKLSLDANLLPITHAIGGEADIVYEYEKNKFYNKHCLLLEATLTDGTNQRRMEMEPVSRHLGNHLLKTNNNYSYCIFATSYLHVNVISDFMNRKFTMYCDPQNTNNIVTGMKIIPLCTTDLKNIIMQNISYCELYEHFSIAYDKISNTIQMHPLEWYDQYVKIVSQLSD